MKDGLVKWGKKVLWSCGKEKRTNLLVDLNGDEFDKTGWERRACPLDPKLKTDPVSRFSPRLSPLETLLRVSWPPKLTITFRGKKYVFQKALLLFFQTLFLRRRLASRAVDLHTKTNCESMERHLERFQARSSILWCHSLLPWCLYGIIPWFLNKFSNFCQVFVHFSRPLTYSRKGKRYTHQRGFIARRVHLSSEQNGTGRAFFSTKKDEESRSASIFTF